MRTTKQQYKVTITIYKLFFYTRNIFNLFLERISYFKFRKSKNDYFQQLSFTELVLINLHENLRELHIPSYACIIELKKKKFYTCIIFHFNKQLYILLFF